MSLYEKTNINQGPALTGVLSTLGLTKWLLALSGYFFVVTLTNRIPRLILWLERDGPLSEYIGYFLGEVTGVFSAVALLFFLFRRSAVSLYYLILVSVIYLPVALASYAGSTKELSTLIYSFQGLSTVPERIIVWMFGWGALSDISIELMRVANSVGSLAFCILLLYFHRNQQQKAQ